MRFTGNTVKKAIQTKRAFINHQGGTSYTLAPEQELVKMSLTSFLDKSFYETMDDKLQRLVDLCKQVDSEFLIKLASWSRKRNMRTVNQVMLVESMANDVLNLFKKGFDKLVERPDEILDIVWYYVMKNWQNPKQFKLANKLKKAIKAKLEKFDEYKLSKYKSRWDGINIYDLVNYSHAHSKAIDKLMKGKIKPADTWEKKLSEKGNNQESWSELLKENKLWQLAFIRNLRNILSSGVKESDILASMEKLTFDRVFPYQMIQAFEVAVRECNLKQTSNLYKELEKIIYKSFEVFKQYFPWKVAIWLDISWSMTDRVNPKSEVQRYVLGWYYTLAMQEVLWADIFLWDKSCTKENTVSMEQIRRKCNGGTDIQCLFDRIEEEKEKYDTLLVITDEQNSRRGITAPDNVNNVVIWNIADYQGSTIPTFDDKFTYLTWLNDSMFSLIWDLNNLDGLVKAIRAIEI